MTAEVLAARLRARQTEVEQAILARVRAIPDPVAATDPEYAAGLRAAVSAAVDYSLGAIESHGTRVPPIPVPLLAQARLAARSEVSLDTVLRRYFAGYTLLTDLMIEESGSGGALREADLKRLLRTQAPIFDRLVATISEEHGRDRRARPDTSEGRRYDMVRRLLAGELLSSTELDYELEGFHLGLVACGPGKEEALRQLARALDRRLLMVRRDEGVVWSWLSGRRALGFEELRDQADSSQVCAEVTFAVGEPGEGVGGWRLSHRQARAALTVALRGSQRLVHYADVALSASILQDDLLTTSLRQLYLVPLSRERDRGAVLLETLRAYFAASRNSTSAAAALGVSRQTVASRLRVVEGAIGRPIDDCGTDIEAAMRLHDLPAAPRLLISRTDKLRPQRLAT